MPFKTLRRVRKGWPLPKMIDPTAPLRKPNLRPPGHDETYLDDFGKHIERHPAYRMLNNLERLAELDDLKRRGKGPPTKGAGSRASKGKK